MSGQCASVRSGANSSTSFSNGTSWCSTASRVTSLTRPSSPAKVGSPASDIRSATVFVNMPMIGSSSV